MYKKLTAGLALTLLLVGCTEEATKEVDVGTKDKDSGTVETKEETNQYLGTKIDGTVMHSSKIDDTNTYVSVDVRDYVLTKVPELEKLSVNSTLSAQTGLDIKTGSLVTVELTKDGVELSEREMTDIDKIKQLLATEGQIATVIFNNKELDINEVLREVSNKLIKKGENQLTMVNMLYYDENHVMNDMVKVEGDYIIVLADTKEIVEIYKSIEEIK